MAIPTTDSVQGQPVRTINPGDVQVKVGDGTTPTQYLAIDTTGRVTVKLDDAAGNGLTSQVNGAQRALDVGINVAGIQIDPRLTGIYNTTLPTLTTGTFAAPSLDSNGRMQVVSQVAANFLATVTQGTSPWITSDLADGSVAPGTAGTKSLLAGGVYNSAGITLTTGQQSAIQLNAAGGLIIRPLTAVTDNVTVTQGTSPWISSDLANGPVSPGAAASKSELVGAVFNSTPPVLTNGQQAALQVDAGGNLKVTVSSTTVGNPVNNYFVSAANVAYGASDTHTYTITSGKTFNGKKFWASASGRIRIDVQTVIGGTTSTVFTGFSSTSDPNITIDMDEFYVPDSGTTAQIQIVRYNEEPGTTFSMFSTICGTEN